MRCLEVSSRGIPFSTVMRMTFEELDMWASASDEIQMTETRMLFDCLRVAFGGNAKQTKKYLQSLSPAASSSQQTEGTSPSDLGKLKGILGV